MVVPQEIRKGLWVFPIVLPNNPLKWLNCYVVKGENGGRNLLVDSGFNMKECQQDLLDGIAALELDMHNTDVFFTHHHSDHTGNAQLLESLGATLYISRDDFLVWKYATETDFSGYYESLMSEGVPRELAFFFGSVDNNGVSDTGFTENCRALDEGDVMQYGDYLFECIYTRGHTPGHMCLYDREKEILLVGDHVLFDITPNIIATSMLVNSLEVYINNLKRVKALPVQLALPAHRQQGSVSLAERADRLIAHHERRLAEMEQIIADSGDGVTAYELTKRSRWKIRASSWEEFPNSQKWFALHETLAHLIYLVDHGRVEKSYENDLIIYKVKK